MMSAKLLKAMKSKLALNTIAGPALNPSKTPCTTASICELEGSGAGSMCPASESTYCISAADNRRAFAIRFRLSDDIRISRPCSNHVYQVSPTKASEQTSSRRRPGVRRRLPRVKPSSSGAHDSLRARRNFASSFLFASSIPKSGSSNTRITSSIVIAQFQCDNSGNTTKRNPVTNVELFLLLRELQGKSYFRYIDVT